MKTMWNRKPLASLLLILLALALLVFGSLSARADNGKQHFEYTFQFPAKTFKKSFEAPEQKLYSWFKISFDGLETLDFPSNDITEYRQPIIDNTTSADDVILCGYGAIKAGQKLTLHYDSDGRVYDPSPGVDDVLPEEHNRHAGPFMGGMASYFDSVIFPAGQAGVIPDGFLQPMKNAMDDMKTSGRDCHIGEEQVSDSGEKHERGTFVFTIPEGTKQIWFIFGADTLNQPLNNCLIRQETQINLIINVIDGEGADQIVTTDAKKETG